jgi:uncharacterized protein (DUF433 family)
MGGLLAFTLEQAAQVVGVSERRLRYWDRTGVLRPSLARGEARGAFSRIYSFRDLVGLRALAALRDQHGCSLQQLRLVGRWLTEHRDAPWSSLRVAVQKDEIVFTDPTREPLISIDHRDRATASIELEQIASQTEALAARLAERQADQIGKITRNRYVMGNAPVIAGTRIPTEAIWDFHRAGYSTAAIVEEYPRLTDVDVERAIAFERERWSQRQLVD